MIELVKNNVLLILFLPVWVCVLTLVNSFVKFTDTKKLTLALTLFSTFIGLVFSSILFGLTVFPYHETIEHSFLWFSVDSLYLYFGILIDNISSLFLLVLFSISFIVQLYSYGYMKNDEEYNKYFILLNFFNFSMSALILSSNLIQTYIFWELVGVVSYLLIGFWYKKYNVSKSAQKVFWINRVGDTSLLLGILILLYFSLTYSSSIQQVEILSFANIDLLSEALKPLMYPETYLFICLLLLFGALVKSAQFPLNVWLVDAMKAPTPVSALIHSATMVGAGVFLALRLYPFFLAVPILIKVMLVIGIVTSVLCSFFALTQKNVKKMLAYSTSSHLGLMFASLGVFAPTATIIYFTVHAYSKALLFLLTGVVSKMYNNELNMNKMGGLRHSKPVLAIMWFIAGLSACGLCFAGFSAKEVMLVPFFTNSSSVWLVLILLSILFSSIYVFKSYFKIFEGEIVRPKSFDFSKSMYFSSVILTFIVIALGFFINLDLLKALTPKNFFFFEFSDIKLMIISISVGLLGIIFAYLIFKYKKFSLFIPKWIVKLSYHGGYISYILNIIAKDIFINLFKVINFIDKYIIESLINLFVLLVNKITALIKMLQNGNFQTYIAYSIFTFGVFLLLILYYFNFAKELN